MLGTAIRNIEIASVGLQVPVDRLKGQALGDHEHLQVVEQLADFFGGPDLSLIHI